MPGDAALRAYVDVAEVILVAIGIDERVQFINRAGCELLGREENQVLGRNWFDDFLPAEVRGSVRDVFRRLLAGETVAAATAENPVAARDGSTRIILWRNRVACDASGAVLGTISSGQDVTDLRATESALRAQVELLRTFVRTVPAAAYQVDERGAYVQCNDAFAHLVGTPVGQLLGRKASDIAPLEPTAGLERRYSTEAPPGGVTMKECRLLLRDGTSRDVICTESAYVDATGSIAGHVGVLRDVTLQNQMDRSVRQQVAVDVALAEFASNSTAVSDAGELDRIALESARRLTQSARAWVVWPESATGQLVMRRLTADSLHDAMVVVAPPAECHPADESFPCGSAGIVANRPGELPAAVAAALNDAPPKRFACVPLWRSGTRTGCIAVADAGRDYDDSDISTLRRVAAVYSLAAERVRASRNLEQSEEKFRTLVDNLGVGVCRNTADLRGHFVEANRAFARIFGWSDPAELIGRSVLDLYGDPDGRTEFLEEVTASGGPVRRQMSAIRADGQRIWIGIVATAARDADGRVAWIDGIVEDITEQRRREADLLAGAWLDPLTGLYNRRGLLAVAEQQLKLARRRKETCLVLYFDVDGLKPINDRHGHERGDAALCEVAAALRMTFRDSDVVARVGGDEFVTVALGARADDANAMTRRLASTLSQRAADAQFQDGLVVSVGVLPYDPSDKLTLEEAMAEADSRMLAQKRGKRTPSRSGDRG